MLKRYRVYFNRELDFPQAWSVDEGDQSTEINVNGFHILGADCFSKVLSVEERAGVNPTHSPLAWLQVDGELRMEGGIAIFTRGVRV